MKKCHISVIVTFYNKEKYVIRCLQSIINQSYQDIQVIIVDDGSTDQTQALCRKFQNQYKTYCELYSQNNQGVSSARNTGLMHVKGERVVFVDGDDVLSKDYLADLYAFSRYDLVQSGYLYDSKNRKISFRPKEASIMNFGSIEKYIFNKEMFPLFSVPWAKLYKSSIIKENNLLFKNQQYGEDTIFVFNYLKYVNNIKIISSIGYENKVVEGTLSRQKIKNIWTQVDNIVKSGNDVFNYKFNCSWAFLEMRSIKLTLLNSSDSYSDFKSDINEIIKYEDFGKLNMKLMPSKTEKVILALLRSEQWLLLYFMVKIKAN
ncbi:hypothetical protein C5Z25_02720 [Lactobacillus sp. CBA3605]|uniref:glycosyltransferase family 2 protein n=1 Tax=Lactobacillus sp. CBA3605 TaxID=2099788 RepID=UPI000CFC04C3|nr:glycosyltransferase family A protein [Lactobacillus sp. CBA3605]AVK60724.1 hypothetical protein C5Z25_02720 [Lactobacillus sp. CBA3605]